MKERHIYVIENLIFSRYSVGYSMNPDINILNADYNINKKIYSENVDYIQQLVEELNKKVNKSHTLYELKEADVSSSLSDDAKAKLQLLYGDFIVIPIDKL